jgi:hypothetical protein
MVFLSYALLYLASIMLAVDTGLRTYPDLSLRAPKFVTGKVWGFLPFVLLTIVFVTWGIQAMLPTTSHPERISTQWPAFTRQEISDWASALRPFPLPISVDTNYSSEVDQDFVAGVVEIEGDVNWSYAGAGLGGVESGIHITASKDREDAARELQRLIEKKTNTRVSLVLNPAERGVIHLYVGRKPAT